MKSVNYQIFKTLLEIFIASFIIVFSFSICNKTNTNMKQVFAMNNGNVDLKEIEPLNINNIFPVSNDDALNFYDTAKYEISNKGTNKSNYKLVYRINNTSTVKKEWLNYYIKINDISKIYKLSDLKLQKSENYTDIILYSGEVKNNETVKFEFLTWLDESIGNEAQNKNLSANIMLVD